MIYRKITVLNNNLVNGRYLTPEEVKEKEQYLKELRKKILKLFIQYKANTNILDADGESLLQKCLTHQNYELLGIIVDAAPVTITSKLINTFSTLIYNPEVKVVFDLILQKSKPTKEIINEMDDNGFTPFLKFLKDFLTNAQSYRNKIYNYVQMQLKKLKSEGQTEFPLESYKISYANYMRDSYNIDQNVGNYTL